MLTSAGINTFFNKYIKDNTNIAKSKIAELELFREKEMKLKEYNEALGELEKEQYKVNLTEFEGLKIKTVSILMDFDPTNIQFNIDKVHEIVSFFTHIEKDLIEVSNSLKLTINTWKRFLERNEEFKNSVFSEYANQKILTLRTLLAKVSPQEVGVLNNDIEAVRLELEKIMLNVERIKENLSLNIFMGKESIKIRESIENLISVDKNTDIGHFNKNSKELLQKLEKSKLDSIKGCVPVQVYKVYNKKNVDIHRYTVKFGDYMLTNDSFFLANDLAYSNTGEYIYFENFPIEGVFLGADIVKYFYFDIEYIEAVKALESKANMTFLIFSSILLFSGVIVSFLGLMAVTIFTILTIISGILFKPYLRNLKKGIEILFKRDKIFVFSKINFFIASLGNDAELKVIHEGAIQNFDNTILNEKFHKQIENNWQKMEENGE